jgi:excisionase family DNA binding protein
MYYGGDVIERLDRIEYSLDRLAKDLSEVRAFPEKEGRLLLTVNEAAKQLRLSKTYIYQMIATGKLPSIRIGRSLRISTEGMMAWIRNLESQA